MAITRGLMGFCLLGTLAGSVTVPALARDSAVGVCRKEADPMKRLACYDAIPDHVDEATAAKQQRQFGLSDQQRAPEDRVEAKTVTAKITTIAGSRVTLANGMVWKVEDGHLLDWIRQGQMATISRGPLSGYRMVVDGANGKAVVTRVQ